MALYRKGNRAACWRRRAGSSCGLPGSEGCHGSRVPLAQPGGLARLAAGSRGRLGQPVPAEAQPGQQEVPVPVPRAQRLPPAARPAAPPPPPPGPPPRPRALRQGAGGVAAAEASAGRGPRGTLRQRPALGSLKRKGGKVMEGKRPKGRVSRVQRAAQARKLPWVEPDLWPLWLSSVNSARPPLQAILNRGLFQPLPGDAVRNWKGDLPPPSCNAGAGPLSYGPAEMYGRLLYIAS